MELTKEQAIDLSIELWTWLAKTGKEKDDWLGWDKYGGRWAIWSNCFLCEYDALLCGEEAENEKQCSYCPLTEEFGDCYKTYFYNWELATTPKTRKKYALLFLEQLKQLKES